MSPERAVEAAGPLRVGVQRVLFRLGCRAPDLAAFFPQHAVRFLRRLRPDGRGLPLFGIGIGIFLTTIFELGQGLLNIFLLLVQGMQLLALRVELFQILQQALELLRIFRRQLSKGQFVLEIGFLCRDAAGLGFPVRRADIRLPYSAVGFDGKVRDLLFQLLVLGVQLLLGGLCRFLVQKRLQFGFLGFQSRRGFLVPGGLNQRIYGGDIRFQLLLRQRLLFRPGRGRVLQTVLFQIQPGFHPVLARIVAKALVRAGEMDKMFHAGPGVCPDPGLRHVLFHSQALLFHLPGGKRAHAAAAAKAVGRVIGCPELVIRRVDLFVQDGVRRPYPLVHDGQILPVRAGGLHGLHFLVAPGGVGRLQVGAKDVLDAVVMPALRLDGRHDAFLELRQRLPAFQGFLKAVAHQLHQIMLGQPRDVESPVLRFLAQRLGFRIRELGPPLPELDGRVRGHAPGDDLRLRQVELRLFLSHLLPPRPEPPPPQSPLPPSGRGPESSPAHPGP